MYIGDFTAGGTVRCFFNTRASATGAPITISGTPAISIYKDGGTTESTAGVTLSVDFDSRTGLHLVAIDTSADGAFYAAGSDYQLVITTGTVDSVSQVGVTVGKFSISNRSTFTAPTAAENAEALLVHDMSAVVGEAARSPLNALRFLRNGFSIAGTTLTVLKEDDTTPAYTRDLTTNASAVPITGIS